MRYLPVQEAAERLGVTDQTVLRWVKKGFLRASKIGRIIRVDEESVDLLLKNNEIIPVDTMHRNGRPPKPLPARSYRHLP